MRIERDQLQTLVVVGVLVVGFVAGIWWPEHHRREQLQAQIDQSRGKLHDAAASHRHIRQWYEQITAMRQRLRYFPSKTPRQEALANVLRGLSEALGSGGVSDQEVITGQTKQVKGFAVVPIRVRFRSSFPGAYGVMRRIETMGGLLRVDDLEIHQPRANARKHTLRVQLQLSTFFSGGKEAD